MTLLQTIILGIVEGITEFLPISSTGHMIIVQSLLGIPSTDFVKAFTVIIQFGAIISVIVFYFKRFFQTWDFYWKLILGFIPAGVLGLAFNKYIDAFLGNVTVVSVMLILGGIIMLFSDRWFSKTDSNQRVTNKKAFVIGCFQCLAMLPGFSRSMATIVGGMQQKLTRKKAAEFSFFLAVPTMAAATGYKMLKLLTNRQDSMVLHQNISTLLIGTVVAFVVALIAIKFFIDFISKHGFKSFGIYRIIVGVVILVLLYVFHFNLAM